MQGARTMGVRLRGLLAALGAGVLGISVLVGSPALAAPGDFISRWTTTETSVGSSDANQIRLPLLSSGTYNFTVDWEDGSTDTITAWDQDEVTHTYVTPGVKTIKISGSITGWAFANGGDRLKIENISQWGGLHLGNTGHYFEGAARLALTATDSPDLNGTSSLEAMFAGINGLSGNLNGWNTSGVTNMSEMFAGDILFNSNISNWNVSAVTTMSGMFRHAEAFNQDIGGWKTTSLTDMRDMFNWAVAFNQDIGAWDVSKVTDMGWAFNYAMSFNQDIGSWDTGNVTDMSWLFSAAVDFNQDIGSWDTGNVTDMSWMFASAGDFDQDIGSWDTRRVTQMEGMFWDAGAFNGPIGSWNTALVADMSDLFHSASSFNQPLNWDTSSVNSMSGMFCDAEAFNQDLNSWDVAEVTAMSNMFEDASAFNGAFSNWDTGAVLSMIHMFTGAVSFNQPIGGWDVSEVTSMEGMLAGALAFNQNLGSWDVGRVTDLSNFLNAVNLSVANYNSLLNGWAALPVLQSGVPLMAGNNHYTSLAAAAHDHLTQGHGWTIMDGGILNSDMNAVLNPTDFGGQDLGFSGQRTVTVSSGGPPFADLIFGPSAVSITGADASMFAIVEDNCSGKTMPPLGDVCTVTVTFTPTSIGAKAAQLRFVSNSPQSPYTVPLIGTGVAPVFTADAQSLAFGRQPVGTPATARVVTVGNAGNKHMAIGPYNVRIKGSNADQFLITAETCRGALLNPGQTCTVSVVFTAMAAGEHSAYLEILDSAPGTPHMVGLTGTAFSPVIPTPPPTVTLPAAPTGLTVKAKKRIVKATWKPVTGANGYRAKLTGKTPKNKRTSRTINGTAGTTAKFGLKLKAGSTFKVCVTAFNGAGTSPATCTKGKAPR